MQSSGLRVCATPELPSLCAGVCFLSLFLHPSLCHEGFHIRSDPGHRVLPCVFAAGTSWLCVSNP